jgi:hypothetical protein
MSILSHPASAITPCSDEQSNEVRSIAFGKAAQRHIAAVCDQWQKLPNGNQKLLNGILQQCAIVPLAVEEVGATLVEIHWVESSRI